MDRYKNGNVVNSFNRNDGYMTMKKSAKILQGKNIQTVKLHWVRKKNKTSTKNNRQ